jgi:CRP-like cAMP-binding protein
LLLRALSEADYALVEPHLEREQLKLRDPIWHANEPIERIYFLEEGVASIVSEQ